MIPTMGRQPGSRSPTSLDRRPTADVSRRINPTRRCGETRRDWPVPIASGQSAGSEMTSGGIELPIVVVAALETLGVTIPTFLDHLWAESTSQDVVFSGPETGISVEAHLGDCGFSCAIKLARMCWYHRPGDKIHLFCIELPDTVLAATDLPITAVVDHHLLTDPRIVVRNIGYLNAALPGIGIRLRLAMPTITCFR